MWTTPCRSNHGRGVGHNVLILLLLSPVISSKTLDLCQGSHGEGVELLQTHAAMHRLASSPLNAKSLLQHAQVDNSTADASEKLNGSSSRNVTAHNVEGHSWHKHRSSSHLTGHSFVEARQEPELINATDMAEPVAPLEAEAVEPEAVEEAVEEGAVEENAPEEAQVEGPPGAAEEPLPAPELQSGEAVTGDAAAPVSDVSAVAATQEFAETDEAAVPPLALDDHGAVQEPLPETAAVAEDVATVAPEQEPLPSEAEAEPLALAEPAGASELPSIQAPGAPSTLNQSTDAAGTPMAEELPAAPVAGTAEMAPVASEGVPQPPVQAQSPVAGEADSTNQAPLLGFDEMLGIKAQQGHKKGVPDTKLPLEALKQPGRPTAAEASGVESNQAGDLFTLSVTVATGVITVIIGYSFHAAARLYFPLTYNHPEIVGQVPKWTEGRHGGYFGMCMDSLKLSVDEIQAHANLDHAMLIEYTHLAMKLCLVIGLPSMFILAPLNGLLGGNRSGGDNLSKQGMANVEDGSWLYWVHSVAVWCVVIITDRFVLDAMRKFIKRRSHWLKEMPAPQDTTVLMECIPPEFCTDVKLGEYFNAAFQREVVESAHMVKVVGHLEKIASRVESTKLSLKKAEEHKARTGESLTIRDRSESFQGVEVDQTTYYTKVLDKLQKEKKEERERLLQAAEAGDPAVYCTSGFITFKDKRDAEMVLQMRFTEDDAEWVAHYPPDPSDVIYADLQVDQDVQKVRDMIGHALIVVLIIVYLPLVLAISSAASLENLKHMFPFMKGVEDDFPVFAGMWDALAASIGLLVVLSFLPTILLFISDTFFVTRGSQYSQLNMQTSYFWLQVLYVLLVTAIGTSIVQTTKDILESPTHILQLLAQSMPEASHFYLKYMATSWGTHATIFTRHVVLAKYLIFRMVLSPEDARAMSEPEDQDFYGMGSRSARFSLMLAIGLVYSTLSPLMSLLTFVNFALCRVFYGYLFVYCEDRSKPDLGGEFFVKQLQHALHAISIYILLMAGVLLARSDSKIPGIIALCSGFLHLNSKWKLMYGLRWHSLTLEAINEEYSVPNRKARRDTYVQHVLCDD